MPIFQDLDGHRVETNDAEADPVQFWRQGGGFRNETANADFHTLFKPSAPAIWRAGTVTAEWLYTDGIAEPKYPCWSDGDVWNGWGKPHFTKAVIDELLAATAGLSERVEWVGGKLMLTEDDEIFETEPITVLGCREPVYGLGAGSWTWDQIIFSTED